jgi:glycosyltransferase involved in cell wall biosynthesis
MIQSQSLPLVTVVTPSFNQAQFLEATMRSVLEQEYPRVEYIVMDGGSTDGSIEVIRKYESRLAYWHSGPDRGQSDAINQGWRRAQGEILAYLNSDDTLRTDAIRLSVQALESAPGAGLAYGACGWMDADGKTLGVMGGKPFRLSELILQNRLPQPTVFLRRSALNRVGMLDESLHYMMDYDLWLRVALEFPTALVPKVIADFRLHQDSKTAGRYKLFLDENLRILEKTFANPTLPTALVELRPRATNYAYLTAALHCYGLGAPRDGHEIMERWFEMQADPLAYPKDIIALFANHMVSIVPLRDAAFSPADGARWLDGVLADLPPSALGLSRYRQDILAEAYLAWGFDAHTRGDLSSARRNMLRALEYHPRNVRNRGVWSVLFKSLLANGSPTSARPSN